MLSVAKKMKRKPWTVRKYLQNIYLIIDWYPEYIQNIHNYNNETNNPFKKIF